MSLANTEGGQARVRDKPQLPKPLFTIQRYGLAVLSVAVALGVALLLARFHLRDVEVPLFLFAVALVAWYGGPGPALLALLLACLCFDYFFTEPLYTLYISLSDIPYFLVFTLLASLVTWFSVQRRRAEQELRQTRDKLEIQVAERTRQAGLLNLTHDSIFVRDTSDVITYWNRGAQELFGWSPEEAVGRRVHELLRSVFPAPVEEIHADLLRSGRWEGEFESTRADGTTVIVASRWSLQRDERGQPAAILETSNDITQRKRWEQEIRTLNEELGKRSADLEASNKELEAFAYSISHDLRAPLRHMAGFTELLQKSTASVLDEKSKRYVTMILESAQRMGSLIDDLLAFSRIGRAETHKTGVDLEGLVREAVMEARQDIHGRDVVWRVGRFPYWYGDRSMLRLVLVNLISNALNFTRTRSRAEIEIGCLKEDKNQVVVFVRDNGVGFDMRYASKLFGVFQRLHRAEAFEGTGIGLATVQRIVHRHGGKVWAESLVDKGATFYFSLAKNQGV
jgi:PAS domain S-box-containing protein